jgi:hypothetical protein
LLRTRLPVNVAGQLASAPDIVHSAEPNIGLSGDQPARMGRRGHLPLTGAPGPSELLRERGAYESLHAYVVTDTVFFQLSDDAAGDPGSELDELFFIDRLHVF